MNQEKKENCLFALQKQIGSNYSIKLTEDSKLEELELVETRMKVPSAYSSAT